MSGKLEFFFDYISPFSYVANAAVKDLQAKTGTQIVFRPIFLGAIMRETGNRPPGMVPAKGAYMVKDLARCSARHDLPFRMNPLFPIVDTRKLLKATCGMASDPIRQQAFIDICFHHMWAAEPALNPADDTSIEAMCKEAGISFEEITVLAEESENGDALKTNTADAISRGAFGAPTFFVGDEMFFGHDRLDYAAEALAAQA
ncbi:MAG: 2-hydroxychromene-2-carboxylate isomerase [Alphaproteobacteria bacterium]|nr:2-hydroxychromene-2-carboxylate isomerase [Hyphomonas sp.]MBR9805699.1 2-hydroxychromene-2-carboxylate isomerase [Alphaproteobacteria bacterium]|tara:strand:- start:6105 stop:6710 length:606 start_codon:yes stop_codon:yes gene_type:complete